MSPELLELINGRRVTRYFRDTPVPAEHLWSILRAARWAPSASNVRLHSYVCISERRLIEQIRMVSPGIAADCPAAIIAICVHRNLPAFDTLEKNFYEYIDVGTALMNMLLAAHALDVGACPAIMDSPRAVGALLNVPADWSVEMLVLLGYPRPATARADRPRKGPRLEDLVQWGAFPSGDPGAQARRSGGDRE
jgi:nitroreductase